MINKLCQRIWVWRILSSTCPCVRVLYRVGLNPISNAETRDHAHQLRRSSQSRSNSRPTTQGPITWTWQGEPQQWTVKSSSRTNCLLPRLFLVDWVPCISSVSMGQNTNPLGLMTSWRSVPKIPLFLAHGATLWSCHGWIINKQCKYIWRH